MGAATGLSTVTKIRYHPRIKERNVNAAEESAVMIFESCGVDTKGYYSQRRLWEMKPGIPVDVVKRCRKCLQCDQRFTTYEPRERDPGEVWPLVESAEGKGTGQSGN